MEKLNLGQPEIGKGWSPYQHGWKRCTLCNKWYPPDPDLRHCPDCGKQLKTTPNRSYRHR